MTTIYSADGTTVTRRYRDVPRWHWQATSPTSGEYVDATVEHGYFALVETARPDDSDDGTHDYTIVRDGDTFVETWTARAKTDDEQAADRQSQAPDPLTVLTDRAVAAGNSDPQPWVQPVGAHDAYLPGAIVLDGVGGDRWRNDLGVVNVWPLTERHARWTNLDAVVPVGPQPWQPWSGFNEDLYQIGDEVTHAGQTWRATHGNNHWAPDVFGWVVV